MIQKSNKGTKELQISIVEMGVSVHKTTLSCRLHRAGLYGSVETVSRKKISIRLPKRMEEGSLVRSQLLGHCAKCYMWRKPNTSPHPEKTIPTVRLGGNP